MLVKRYINKVQAGIQRMLSGSEYTLCIDFFRQGISVKYAIEYFK